ncbi:MAG: ribulose-phosphate 3-epimerase [Bacteroidetes bacterium]|uniref:Ribulose-phosphate 3-epimerase n=1 Tax=Candidatus Caccoplasma merdipullorum TaxID=2840718 RepID=A0A9D9H619_9BACT|nr:ribulose-phosphate 3-epimerase [Candidatus Caccoplasma merdipullorum]
MAIVSPSLLSADFGNLASSIEMINRSEAEWLHIDVMDGVFVPNISFGFPVLEYVKKLSQKPLDVHLMIVEPTKFIKQVKDCGGYIMNVHYEASTHLHRSIQQIKEAGMKAAVTLNPHTPVSLLEDIVADLDMVLLMSVNPGFGGQKFISNTVNKVAALKELILKKNSGALIEVDGGINQQTGKLVVDAGADVLVAGNWVFKSEDPIATISGLKSL